VNFLTGLFSNYILIPALVGWLIAQVVKLPLEYLRTKQWNWVILLRTGGMPSSHSALVAGIAHGMGLHEGFSSPIFALGVTLAIVVIYDATGIRRQAGKHAKLLNTMINELAAGHPLKNEQMLEFLGHTPLEALAGTLLGIACAQLGWMLWK
jgi:hypothetical protein